MYINWANTCQQHSADRMQNRVTDHCNSPQSGSAEPGCDYLGSASQPASELALGAN